MQIDGRYLGRNDQDFVAKVSRDLEAYLTSSNDRNRVLLFPPLSSRHRFLIHKLAEEEELVSFSIGENEKRRTVVCFQDTLNRKQSSSKVDMDDEMNLSIGNTSSSFEEATPSRARNRRPDKPLYVPKAKRSEETGSVRSSESKVDAITSSVKKELPDSKAKDILADKRCESGESNTKTKTDPGFDYARTREDENSSETVVQESLTDFSSDRTCVLDTECLSAVLEFDSKDEFQSENRDLFLKVELQNDDVSLETKESVELLPTEEVSITDAVKAKEVIAEEHSCDRNGVDGPLISSTVTKPYSSQTRRKSSCGESWDALYDQSGECLDSSLLDQLAERVGKVTIETPQIDYWSASEIETTKSVIDEELGHVVEIHDFPVDFKTQDLISAFSHFKDRGFDIKWVDDTHALGVFSSRMAAQEALSLKHPFIKTRPLSQGIKESRRKAQSCSEFLQPYKARPETSALLARRLVAGALGLQVQVSREQREEERRKLREAKERKRLVVKQKEAAWNGDVDDS